MSRPHIPATDRAKLREMADKLPPLQSSNPDGTPRWRWEIVNGYKLLQDNPKACAKDGSAISATKTYDIKHPIMVNHYECLRVAYEKGGMARAGMYCQEVMDFIAKAKRPRPTWQRTLWAVLLSVGIKTKAMREAQDQINLLTGKA